MEHSYTRDFRPMENSQTATTRTLMVHRPPQCPSCHTHTHAHDERIDLEESYNPPIPSYNEESAKIAMLESETITKQVRNLNSEDADWEEKINKIGWSVQQTRLFGKVTKLLDMDRLARLTIADKQHEPVHRRMVIDKSVSRLRQALAGVSWDPRLTQWIHGLLMESLPASYLAAYIDILQTLKAKLPNLVDKMIFGRPLNINQELLGPVLKKPWEPIVSHKNRKLPGQPFIMVVPSGPNISSNSRIQKWYPLFATMASVIPITMPQAPAKQTLQAASEQLVAVCRAKIQDVRQEAPNRPIILVGFNAGAALAIQVGLVEAVSAVVCLGFSYHTVNGPRGAPDDHITDLTAPVLFVIGQMSARASQEEVEFLRERMIAQTSLVVVGSADDCLRVCKSKRKIEGVTQSMVDNMIMDEIAEFATNCLLSPPRPKQPIKDPNGQKSNLLLSNNSSNLAATAGPALAVASSVVQPVTAGSNASTTMPAAPGSRKRKAAIGQQDSATATHGEGVTKAKVGRPPGRKTTPSKTPKQTRAEKMLLQQSQQAIDAAIQSILPTADKAGDAAIKQTSSPVTNTQTPTTNNSQEVKNNIGGPQIVSGVGGTSIMLPILKRESTAGAGQQLQVLHTQSPNQIVQPSQQQLVVSTVQTMATTPTAAIASSNIKVIPANQFFQLKPSGTPQKFFTVKSSPKPVVSVIPKLVSSAASSVPTTPTTSVGSLSKTIQMQSTSQQQQTFSPTKFTIVRGTGTALASSISPIKGIRSPSTPDLSNTNIFDIPIVFADSEGNIPPEGSPQKVNQTANIVTITPSSSGGNITTATTTPTTTARFVTLQPSTKPNKVVVINKGNIKQLPASVLSVTPTSRPMSTPTTVVPGTAGGGVKYAKVLLTNPLPKTIAGVLPTAAMKTVHQSSASLIIAPNATTTTTSAASSTTGKVEILSSTTVKPCLPVVSTTSSLVGTVSQPKFQPIIINVDPTKTTTMKSFVRVGETQIRPIISANPIGVVTATATTTTTTTPASTGGVITVAPNSTTSSTVSVAPLTPGTNTILIKTNALSQFATGQRKPTILNRNITVRKVNILPQNIVTSSAATMTTVAGPSGQQQQPQQQQQAKQ